MRLQRGSKKESTGIIDILVDNAGFISLLIGRKQKEGVERQFGINHLGHFLLTMKLLCRMKEGSRIVNVASGAHKADRIHFNDINLHRGSMSLQLTHRAEARKRVVYKGVILAPEK